MNTITDTHLYINTNVLYIHKERTEKEMRKEKEKQKEQIKQGSVLYQGRERGKVQPLK